MNSPLSVISVVIPHYNRIELCLRAIESVCSQDYPSIELVVVDDGSTVDISRLESRLAESGRLIVLDVNQGVSAARNRGVAASQGRYVAFLDSDDEWLPNKVSRQVAYLESDNECRICQTQEEWIDCGRLRNPGRRHQKLDGEFFEESLSLCLISPSAVMLERALFDEHRGFDENLRVCEDYELWLRILLVEKVGLLDEVLVRKYAGHGGQLSKSTVAMDRFRVYALLKLINEHSHSSSDLSAISSVLCSKAEVLAGGARKRNKTREAKFWSSLAETAREAVNSAMCKQHLTEIHEYL